MNKVALLLASLVGAIAASAQADTPDAGPPAIAPTPGRSARAIDRDAAIQVYKQTTCKARVACEKRPARGGAPDPRTYSQCMVELDVVGQHSRVPRHAVSGKDLNECLLDANIAAKTRDPGTCRLFRNGDDEEYGDSFDAPRRGDCGRLLAEFGSEPYRLDADNECAPEYVRIQKRPQGRRPRSCGVGTVALPRRLHAPSRQALDRQTARSGNGPSAGECRMNEIWRT